MSAGADGSRPDSKSRTHTDSAGAAWAPRGAGLRDARGLGLGQLRFFGFFDVDDVGGDDSLRLALRERLPLVEPQRAVAELLDQVERVRHQQNRLVAPPELRELVEALHGERLVADGEHLVDQQHIGIDVNRDGKARDACTCPDE